MVATARFVSLFAVLFSIGCSCGEDCAVGSEGCACTEGGACDEGLTCASDTCVDLGGDADTDSDTDADSDSDTASSTETDSGSDTDTDVSDLPIDVTPADSVILVVDGAVVPQQFTATQGGVNVTDLVVWSIEPAALGAMSATGLFTPAGDEAGLATVTATRDAIGGSTSVTVRIQRTVDMVGISEDERAAFDDSAGADPSMTIAYPYDATVFPRAVSAPELQWFGGAVGDRYRLRLVERFYEYTVYAEVAPPGRLTPDAEDWAAFLRANDGPGDDVQVSIVRMEVGGAAYDPAEQSWTIAPAELPNVVYYWELPDLCGSGNGRILRASIAEPTVDTFFSPGGCWGCHSVSADGSKMVATFDSGSPFPMRTIDLTVDPAEYGALGDATPLGGTFGAFDPTASRILYSDDGNWGAPVDLLRIADAETGEELNADVMGDGCGEPAWSPDGTKVAGICGTSGGTWMFDSSSGQLTVADVDAESVVTNLATIVPQVGRPGRPAYPSFSPDSAWIAYGRPTAGSRSTGDGTLWLTDLDGGEVKELATAGSSNRDFNPVFAPVAAGGYTWIAFISRRDYGNHLVGANRQQIWIAAIDESPDAEDPSHPAFYLLGQEECTKNENPYFAAPPP